MKNLLIILFLLISRFTFAQDNTPKPLIEYEKLNPKKAKKVFKLESSKHRIGRVAFYSYSPSGKLQKETIYENTDGKLVFMFERGYGYDDINSLVSAYKYTEIPSHEHPKLSTTQYICSSDSLTIIIEAIGKNQVDTTFVRTSKNSSGKIIWESEITQRTYKGQSRFNKSDETQYAYNDKGQLVSKLETDKIRGDVSSYKYTYDEDKIRESVFSRKDYQTVTTYKNGLPDVKEIISPHSVTKYVYSYNKKGQEIQSKLYEDGKHIYSYLSTYNKKGLKTKYDMRDESDGSSGIWLYEYDKLGKLIYKIDLYARERKKTAPAVR